MLLARIDPIEKPDDLIPSASRPDTGRFSAFTRFTLAGDPATPRRHTRERVAYTPHSPFDLERRRILGTLAGPGRDDGWVGGVLASPGFGR